MNALTSPVTIEQTVARLLALGFVTREGITDVEQALLDAQQSERDACARVAHVFATAATELEKQNFDFIRGGSAIADQIERLIKERTPKQPKKVRPRTVAR